MEKASPKNRVQNTYNNASKNIQSDKDRGMEIRIKTNSKPNLKVLQLLDDTSEHMFQLKSQTSHNQIQLINVKDNERQPMVKVSKSCQTFPNSTQLKQRSAKRKQITLFILNCIFKLNLACENILFFFAKQSQQKFDYLATTIVFMNVFFLLNSIYNAYSIKQFFCIAFLIDNILLTQIVASIGFVGLNMIVFNGLWSNYFSIITVPLLHFLLSANFRFLLINYRWNRLKTIVYKVILLIGTVVLFGIGTYIMYINYKISQGLDPKMDSRFKDFSLLYTFGNFAFFAQLFMKMSDFDKTGELQFNYHIALQTEGETIETQVEKQRRIQKIELHEFVESKQKHNFRQKIQQNINQKHIFL